MTWDWFRDAHPDATVWVVAGGATSRFISPRFFDDKLVVAVNWAGRDLGLSSYFSVTNHWDDAAVLAQSRPDLPVITSEREMLPPESMTATPLDHYPNVVKVPTCEQPYAGYTTAQHWPGSGDEWLTIGPTSLHLALGWAVHLGAAHVVLVGADCGQIDGAHHVPGYSGNLDGSPPHLHFGLWERTLRDIAGRLRADGVSVHSLNPFVSLALEGHTFTQ